MTYKLQFKHYQGTQHVHGLVEEAVARLRRLLPGVSADAVSLRVLIEKNDVRTLYRVSLTLVVPGRTLAAEEERHDETEAVREAFVELERQLVRHRQKATHAHQYERPARTQAGGRQRAGAAAADARRAELFAAAIDAHLEALYNFVRREIAYHVAMRDLLPGEVADDIVGAVAVRAARELASLSTKRDVRGWLLHLAAQQIEAEVSRSKRERRTVRLQAEAGDWNLAEILAPEGAAPRAPTPEDILASQQLQRAIAHTLSTLPRVWRRAFVLQAREGLALADVARITGGSKSEAAAQIGHARAYLHQRLIEAGLPPHEPSVQSIFGTAPTDEVPAAIQQAIRGQPAA